MTQKRLGKNQRRSTKQKRGRVFAPAALFFFAGIAVALLAFLFIYVFSSPSPHQQGQKNETTVQAPAKSPAHQPPVAKAPEPQKQTAAPAAPGAQPQPSAPPMQPPALTAQPQNQTAAPAVPPETAPQAVTPPPNEKPGAPRLVIVIDDLGGSLEQVQDILSLDLPITFSILPDLAHSSEVDALAAGAGMEVLLHQPMAASHAASRRIRQSSGGLRPGMSVPEVNAVLDAHLVQVPHALGMNNHMGSEATQDHALMAAVMAHLKAKGLFFLDSLTTAKSAAGQEADRAGVPRLTRKVFLDNERGQQAALFMLAQAERDARAKGYAVAIGHPYPETIAALDAWKLRRDKRVRLVTLGALLKGN